MCRMPSTKTHSSILSLFLQVINLAFVITELEELQVQPVPAYLTALDLSWYEDSGQNATPCSQCPLGIEFLLNVDLFLLF